MNSGRRSAWRQGFAGLPVLGWTRWRGSLSYLPILLIGERGEFLEEIYAVGITRTAADKNEWRFHMIRLTRLNHLPLVLNSDLIEHIEVTPDTVISLTTGQKIMVLEAAEEVVERVIEFRRAIAQGLFDCPVLLRPAAPEPGGSESETSDGI